MFSLGSRKPQTEGTRMEKVLFCAIGLAALCAVAPAVKRQYHFIYEPKNWTEAQSYCRDLYTDLVTVNTSDVLALLNSKADPTQMGSTKDAWIGLYFDVVDWNWSLSDEDFYNGQFSFRNWVSGQPDSVWYYEQCGQIYSSGYWWDYYCDTQFTSFCSNVSGTNVSFFFNNQLMTWPDAQSYCREYYTDLASIRNQADNERIRQLNPGLFSWIGLYKNTWKWSNGPLFLYSSWATTPQGGTRSCAAADFGVSGLWRDWQCNVEKAFICHHDPVPFSNFTVKVKLESPSALDLNDPVVLDDLLNKLKQRLKDQGVTANITLKWNNQPNGNIFFKEKKDQK